MTPLAELMRPQTILEVVGQDAVSAFVRQMLEKREPLSLIIQGPPGSGKTTLARIIGQSLGFPFRAESAAAIGIKEVRQIIVAAEEHKAKTGEPTTLFLDEIHRFNKTQQDVLLGAVETGILLLLGATTENPRFEVRSALLSRCHLLRLKAIGDEEMQGILTRALEVFSSAHVSNEAIRAIVVASDGDARKGLTLLQTALQQAKGPEIGPSDVEGILERSLRYDRAGEQHYDYISAFIKSMRAGDANAALYYLAVMLEGGEDVSFIARRLLIFASEDTSASPHALAMAVAVARAVEQVGMPEARIILAHGVIFLTEAPKSRRAYNAIESALADVLANGAKPPPGQLVNETSLRSTEAKTSSCMPAGMEERNYLS